MTLEGHTDGVNTVAITPDSTKIVSGSYDKTLKIWDITNGTSLIGFLNRFYEDMNPMPYCECVNTVAITPDGTKFISGGDNETLKIWDMVNNELQMILEVDNSDIHVVAITSDGTNIVSGGSTLKIWDIASGECLMTLEGHNGRIETVVITPDGTNIVSAGSLDNTLKIWDIASGKCLMTLEGHKGGVSTISIFSDGTNIVSAGSIDNTLKIWDIESGECVYTIDTTYKIAINKNGFFNADDHAIEKYIRINTAPLKQRKLTPAEIKHFRKKCDFL